MTRRSTHRPRSLLLTSFVLMAHLASAAVTWASDGSADARWLALQEQSRRALAALRASTEWDTSAGPATRMVVVGFNGGREGPDSNVSGLVRLRRQIDASMAGSGHVVAMTYNNRDWARAAGDIAAYAGSVAAGPRPLIVVFGHSWGGGAITKFARRLGEHDIEVALAVYVDAFALRNPRVPGNVRYAVNLYQRAGILRGFPLRGKSKLILEDPDATTLLANLQIRPQTDRYFGWHWNLVQPLFYLHHHRMGHDVRLHRYLLTLIEAGDAPADEAPGCALDGDAPCDDDADVARTAAAAGS